jgi:hypothetical protein
MSDIIVNAGCMLFFAKDITHDLKKDVLACTLYTQLAATKQYSRFNETKAWEERHLLAMNRFGWMMSASETFSHSAQSGMPASLWTWIEHTLPSFMPTNAIAEAQACARQIYVANPGQRGFALFTCQVAAACGSSTEGSAVAPDMAQRPEAKTKVVMQLGFVDSTAQLSLVTLCFSRRGPFTSGFLFEPINGDDIVGNLELTFRALRLQGVVYSQFRNPIDEKLQGRRDALMATLVGVNHDHQ